MTSVIPVLTQEERAKIVARGLIAMPAAIPLPVVQKPCKPARRGRSRGLDTMHARELRLTPAHELAEVPTCRRCRKEPCVIFARYNRYSVHCDKCRELIAARQRKRRQREREDLGFSK